MPQFAAFVMRIALCSWMAPLLAWLAEPLEPAARLTYVKIGFTVAKALIEASCQFMPAAATKILGPKLPGISWLLFASWRCWSFHLLLRTTTSLGWGGKRGMWMLVTARSLKRQTSKNTPIRMMA